MALDAWDTYERLGSPEGELGLAQLAIWLAIAPNSKAAYVAYNKARAAVRENGTLEVPMHLRNAPTKLMKGLGYGKGYQYDHDAAGGIALDQQCLPDALDGTVFYEPVDRGLEIKLREKLMVVREARRKRERRAPVGAQVSRAHGLEDLALARRCSEPVASAASVCCR
jgi:putative ATPase